MYDCSKDCFASINGKCFALETGYGDKPCPFQKKISDINELYESNPNFHSFVDKQARSMRININYAFLEKPVRKRFEKQMRQA